ncbi:MAG TPA: response regulator [Phycisphaerae bacterium]|nr:response regulator [Phycisphaerae bacterium]
MAKSPIYIAVLDDEPRFCKALARLLTTHAFHVATFTTGADLLAACASRLPDCLLLDLHMPTPNGFEVLAQIAPRGVPVIVITGHDQPGNAERVRDLGAANYFLKPVDDLQLLEAIRAALSPKTDSTGETKP